MVKKPTVDEIAEVFRTTYSDIIREADEWRPLADHVLKLIDMFCAPLEAAITAHEIQTEEVDARVAEQEEELMEQARLLGMSGEREARLIAELEEKQRYILQLEQKIRGKTG
jgi:hypothetical protein